MNSAPSAAFRWILRLHDVLILKHPIGSHMLRPWSFLNVQLPKQISMKMKIPFPPAKKTPLKPTNIGSCGNATSRPAISAKSLFRLGSSSARNLPWSSNLPWVCMLWKRTWKIKYRKVTLSLALHVAFQCLLTCFPACFRNHEHVDIWGEAPEGTISGLLAVGMDSDAYY